MPIVQAGSINAAAQIVPDLLVQIVPPQITALNGVPSNVGGIVGTASWGPVGSAVEISTYADFVRRFGALKARKYDMGTMVATAVQQGANNLRCVRVTDGTDTAASVNIPSATNLTLTSKYTGTLGNATRIIVSPGSAVNSKKLTILLPDAGIIPETFDNITGTGNAFWVNAARAINNGQNGVRGPSEIVVATAGTGVAAAVDATYSLAGGTDGVTTITGSTLLGSDAIPRRGMYALRGSNAAAAILADCDDTTTWASQVAFGLSEGIFFCVVGPVGQAPAAAATTKLAAGVDTFVLKVLLGDWVYWNDVVNGQPQRLVSPQGFWLGRRTNLSPEQSSLNKEVYGVVSTQRVLAERPYSSAELDVLARAGIDVLTNPVPGGSYFGFRMGRNASSDVTIRGENYTTMTHFIAKTINAALGRRIGLPNTDATRRQDKITLDQMFTTLRRPLSGFDYGMIEDFLVVLDRSNNPPERVGLGYKQADVRVTYLSITEFFIVNVEGGQTVQITRNGVVPR